MSAKNGCRRDEAASIFRQLRSAAQSLKHLPLQRLRQVFQLLNTLIDVIAITLPNTHRR